MCDYASPTSPHLLFKSLHSIPFAESPQPLSGRQSQSRNDDMLFKYPKETPHLLNEQMNLPPPFQRGLNEEEHTRPFMNCNEILYCSICGWHLGGLARPSYPILSSSPKLRWPPWSLNVQKRNRFISFRFDFQTAPSISGGRRTIGDRDRGAIRIGRAHRTSR